MKFFDSAEAEILRKLIANKEDYLQKLSNKFAYQQIQKEILFLKNDILPIVLNNTNIVHSEVSKTATMALEEGLKYNINNLLIHIPINENYINNPVIGIYNPRELMKFGTPGAVEFYLETINMDGNNAEFKTINLPLYTLMNGSK
jgi:hypothetical protein